MPHYSMPNYQPASRSEAVYSLFVLSRTCLITKKTGKQEGSSRLRPLRYEGGIMEDVGEDDGSSGYNLPT